jgi:hypothetical protein
MSAYVGTELRPVESIDDLSSYCQDLFSTIPRSDQRRWAEVYTRGLISVPGRKSIRRISDYIVGWRADQCLQQFVNQSPWKWEPMRRSLAHQIGAALRPRAWVVEEVVFPKNGDRSVGVSKQYSTASQRMLNCQLGLVVLLAGDEGSCPVNWRLLLPQCWDGDEIRRTRAHLPTEERHRPRWQYMLDALDEMYVEWCIPPAPVVLDASQERQVEPLLHGLEERGMRYVIRVGEHIPALPSGGAGQRRQRVPTVGELTAFAAKMGRMTVSWRDRVDGVPTTSRFSAVTVPGGSHTVPVRIGPGHLYRPPRSVLTEWPAGRGRPTAAWLTNLSTARLPELIGVMKLRDRAAGELEVLSDHFGLRTFEGRSFRGWHHHVTLVSAAQIYSTLQRLDSEQGMTVARC